LSRPKAANSAALWLRYDPGWICITMPSSRLIDAISVSIWPRNSSASAAAVADRPVVVEAVERAFGGGDHLDAEALEQRAWALGAGLDRAGAPVGGEQPIGIEPKRGHATASTSAAVSA
jgi:hypothetical protein